MPAETQQETRDRLAESLLRATGGLSTAAMARMESDVGWFRELSAESRSWVSLVVQSGVRGFVDWYGGEQHGGDAEVAASVFGAAPRALAGVITLQQTVDLVRLTIEVVEASVDDLVAPADVPPLRAAVLRYAREVAFATAEVYARAAEARGAWDARLEALVVDAVLRAETDETVLSRASAVGWGARESVAVVLGTVPAQRTTDTDLFDAVRRAARVRGHDALCAVQGDRLVVLLGGAEDAAAAAAPLVDLFGAGPVVVGPVAADLGATHVSARAALAAFRAAGGWPAAPRPVRSSELLPERALAGDGHARRHLVEEVYLPLAGRGTLLETVSTFLDAGSSLEATARALFVHANTVRYRLRQVAEVTGYAPTDPRDGFALRIALVLGRQSGRTATTPSL